MEKQTAAQSDGQKSRMEWLDTAKGIGILSVIVGHANLPVITKLIYAFHMPLFFLISGYFFRKLPWTEIYTRRIKRFLREYLLTSALIILGKTLVSRDFSETLYWLQSALYGSGANRLGDLEPIGAIWFLLAVSWATIAMNALPRSSLRSFLCVVGIAGFCYYSSRYVWLPLSIQAGGLALLYMWAGKHARDFLADSEDKKVTPKLQLVAAVLSLAVMAVIFFVGKDHFACVSFTCPNGLLDLLGGFAGTLLVLQVSQCVEQITPLRRVLTFYGTDSMTVLCAHTFEMQMVDWNAVLTALMQRIPMRLAALGVIFGIKIFWVTLCVWLRRKVSKR